MTAFSRRGLLLAGVHVGIVCLLGGKLVLDRATLPRAWVRTAPVDPSLPIRGRYVRLRVEAARDPGANFPPPAGPGAPVRGGPVPRRPFDAGERVPVKLIVRDGRLFATTSTDPRDPQATVGPTRDGEPVVTLVKPLAYFIPDHIVDPSIRRPGEELWVEVTVPRRGNPRPINLGVMRDGVLRGVR